MDPWPAVYCARGPLRSDSGRRVRSGIVLREMSVVAGHVAIAMSGISAFSSMFIGGRLKIRKSNFAKLRAKVGHSVYPVEIWEWGVPRPPSSWCRYLHTRAGVEVVSLLTSSAACSPTRTKWPEAPQK